MFARLKRFNPVIAGEDAGVIVFDFASGATGIFDGNRLVDHPSEDARMTMGIMYPGRHRRHAAPRRLRPALPQAARGRGTRAQLRLGRMRATAGDCVFRQIEHIVAHLLDGAPVVNTGRDYLSNFDDRGGDLPLGRGATRSSRCDKRPRNRRDNPDASCLREDTR